MRGNASIASVEGTLSRGKRDRDLECAQTLSERQKLHVYCVKGEISMPTLKRKAELAVQGECAAQKGLSEAEADVNIRNWEQRNSDIAFYETNRELESQRLELYQANQWADQAQRENINLCGEVEMQNRFFQVAQEIANKLRDYEELVAKKQIEQDNQELMSCVCIKRGILLL